MKKTMRLLLTMIMTASVFLGQSLSVYAASESDLFDSKTRVTLLGKYDSADTASIKQINTYSKTIQFRNHDTGKNYTLSYDNTTHIYDIYGRPISATLLTIGQVVDITFLKGTKHLNSCVVSGEAWVKENVKDFNLISDDQTAKINGETLHLTRKTILIADDQAVNPEDILPTDTIRVSGIDKEIYSIVVTRGHGYVSLSSDVVDDRSLVGAWIELDKEVIRKITPNMLISAPEGSYNVSISGNGAKLNSEIVVARNEETVIDTGVVSIQKEKEGNVTFYVTPSEARVFVDGEEIITEVPHSFTYGKHSLHVMADGYTAVDKYLKVGEKDASIFVDLEPNQEKEEEDDADTSESASEEESADSSTSISIPEVPETSTSASSEATTNNTKKAATSASSSTSTTAGVDSSAAATTVEVDTSSSSTSTGSDSSATSTTSSSSDSSSSQEDENAITGYKISFDAPIGAEAYFDGNYVGIIPISFEKNAGQHMVTLQRDGYETRSYTIQVDKEKTNVTYTFPDLKKVKEESSDSGNTGSDDPQKDDTGDSGDSSDTGDTSDAGDTSGKGDTGSGSSGTGNSGSGSSDTGNTGNTGNTGTGSSDTGNTGDNEIHVPENPGTVSSTDSSGQNKDDIDTGTGSDSGSSTSAGTGNSSANTPSGASGSENTGTNGDSTNMQDDKTTGDNSESTSPDAASTVINSRYRRR